MGNYRAALPRYVAYCFIGYALAISMLLVLIFINLISAGTVKAEEIFMEQESTRLAVRINEVNSDISASDDENEKAEALVEWLDTSWPASLFLANALDCVATAEGGDRSGVVVTKLEAELTEGLSKVEFDLELRGETRSQQIAINSLRKYVSDHRIRVSKNDYSKVVGASVNHSLTLSFERAEMYGDSQKGGGEE